MEAVKGPKCDAFRDRHAGTGRDLVLYLGRKVCGLKLNALAALSGLKEYATVAVAVKRLATRFHQKVVAGGFLPHPPHLNSKQFHRA